MVIGVTSRAAPRPRGRLGAAAALATSAIVLAACGGTGGGAGGGSSTQDGKGTVSGSITYSWWGAAARTKKTQAVIDLFQQAHPGVKVQGEVSDFTNYFKKRNVEAAAKNLPCVPQMQARQLSEYTSRNVLLPLDGMVTSGAIDVSGIPKNVLDTGRGMDGKLYMVPTGAAYDGIMYNARLAQQAGVGDPPAKFTWDQWSSWVLQAGQRLPKGVYAASLDGGIADVLISYVQSNGEQLFDSSGQLGFPKQTLTDFWNMWEKLRTAGATVPADTAAELGATAAQDQTPLMQGKALSANVPGNQLRSGQDLIAQHGGGPLKITTHPYGPKGIGNVLITSGLSIAANCDNVPTAASFLNFFANDEAGAKAFASDNGAVTKTSLLQAQEADPATPQPVKDYLKVYEYIVKEGAPVVLYPAGYSGVFSDLFYREYQQISFGKVSVDGAVEEFFKQAKSMLQK
jgi:multiple sugar transport system substrate-binding protein